MINAIGREGLNKPFSGVPTYDKKEYDVHKRTERADHFQTPEQLLDAIRVEDGMTISFHHHLRNGDHVLPMVMRKIQERKIRGLTVAASSIFPCHSLLVDMMKDGTVTKIHADYISGPVAQAISEGLCRETCVITTHGGRPQEILEESYRLTSRFSRSLHVTLAEMPPDRWDHPTAVCSGMPLRMRRWRKKWCW